MDETKNLFSAGIMQKMLKRRSTVKHQSTLQVSENTPGTSTIGPNTPSNIPEDAEESEVEPPNRA